MKALAVTFTLILAACATLSTRDELELNVYEAQQDACILEGQKDAGSIDKCRADVKKYWCGQWDARFKEAGICP